MSTTMIRGPLKRLLPAGLLAGLLAPLSVPPGAAHTVSPPAALSPATVSVDFGSRQGEMPRPERYNNFGNAAAWPQQRADDVAFLNKQGLHGSVYRVWLSNANAPGSNVFDSCSLATGTCDFSAVDAYLTQASTVSDAVLVNLSPSAFVRGERPLAELRPLLEVIVRNLKDKYPRVKYVEAFNEPDWQFHGQERRAGRPADQTTLRPDDLYRFYAPFYEAVGEVNKTIRHGDRLQVGGPALMWMDPKWVVPFLDDFAADRNPRKRLNFLSYHAYLSWDDDYRTPTRYVSDLGVVAGQRQTLAGWLKQRRLDPHIPAFITETGIYPGPSFDDTDPRNDYIRQAAAMATYSLLYANQPDTYMFNWCVRHFAEERKDQFVTRTPDGPRTDTFTPYGNMLLMQSKMKDSRVSAVAGPRVDDNGVYATASKDRTVASMMVWNWQHLGTTGYRATVDMARLPAELRHGPVHRRIYRIDQNTSNYFTDPAKAGLQLVDEKLVRPGTSYREQIDLAPNAIYLILLEPARR